MLFRILGSLEVEHGGRLLDLGRPKQRALLASLLASANQVVSADRLIDELWGDDPPNDPGQALQVQVSRLRKVLAPAESQRLESRSPGYVLHVGDDELDSLRFEQMVAQAKQASAAGRPAAAAERLRAAFRLWRGPALADFVYAEFAQPHIARLEELRLVALEAQAEAGLALGRHNELVGWLRTLVDEHPLQEKLWRHYILALYRCGRQADALRAFAELRDRLGEELAIEPSPFIATLEEDVLLQRASLDWQPVGETRPEDEVPTNLPSPRSSLVGREQELTELQKLLADGRLVTIVGAGGVGKTRLAIEIAHRRRSGYPDGVWLAELAPLSDLGLLAQTVAAAMNVREQPGQPIADTLVSAVRHRELLLVLDNCEHLIEAAAELADVLLKSGPRLTVLATSREPLRIEGEWVWTAPSLPVPPHDDHPPEALIEFDAVRLFVERAAAQRSFALSYANSSSVAQLCRRLDGVPLAIELAAARVGTLTPSDITRRLDERFELLNTGSRTAPSRHRGLRAAIEWSYELLTPPQQTLFRGLAVFAGSFSLEAAEVVCSGDDIDRSDVTDLISTLVDHSLVVPVELNGERRFRLLESLRAYGAERLRASGEERFVRTRQLTWFTALAESFGGLFESLRMPPGTLRRLDLEHDNARDLLKWALSTEPAGALPLVTALGPFWAYAGYAAEASQWIQSVLAAAGDVPESLRARILQSAGRLALQLGDLPSARTSLNRALAIFRSLGEVRGVADVLESLGVMAFELLGDCAVAQAHLAESVAVLADLGDEHLLSETLARLAVVTMYRGDVEEGERQLQQALRYNLSHPEDPCSLIQEMEGHFALLQGEFEHARSCLEAALGENRQEGWKHLVVRELGCLAELSLLTGRYGEAERILQEVLTTARDLQMWAHVQNALQGYAWVALGRGDAGTARRGVVEAFHLRRARHRPILPSDLEVVAALLLAEGQPKGAARVLAAGESLRRMMGVPLAPAYRCRHGNLVSSIAGKLSTESFAAQQALGRTLSAEDAEALLSLRSTSERGRHSGAPQVDSRN